MGSSKRSTVTPPGGPAQGPRAAGARARGLASRSTVTLWAGSRGGPGCPIPLIYCKTLTLEGWGYSTVVAARPETYSRTPLVKPRSPTAGGMQTELDVSVCGPRGAKVLETSRLYQLLRWQRLQDGLDPASHRLTAFRKEVIPGTTPGKTEWHPSHQSGPPAVTRAAQEDP